MSQCRGIEGREVGVGGWRNTLIEAGRRGKREGMEVCRGETRKGITFEM